MEELIIKIICWFIPIKKWRQKFRIRARLVKYIPDYLKVKKTAFSTGKNLCVAGHSIVNKKTTIKDNVVFNGMQIRGAGPVEIGNYFTCGVECMILTQSHDYDHGLEIPYDAINYIYKPVIIDDFVWFGSRVTILPGTHIGEGAIIQAGAVVHGHIPKYSIAGGNPAKVFKQRDIEHFEKLKKEKKFYRHIDF